MKLDYRTFEAGMDKLSIALDRRELSDDEVEARAKNYYERLGPALTGPEFLAAVDRARDEMHMFPRISDLLEFGLWWRRRQALGIEGERTGVLSEEALREVERRRDEERRKSFKLGAGIIEQVLKAKGLIAADTPSLHEQKQMRKKP